jgi:predicted DNA-binding transcriptional regulator AlpA
MSVAIASPEPKSAVVPAVYKVDDMAQLLQCSVRNIWLLADAGAIPGETRLGRLRRWRVKDVNDWIAAGCPRPK